MKHNKSTLLLLLLILLGTALIAGCISPKTETKPASIEPLDRAKTTAVKAKLHQVEGLAVADLKVAVVNQECTLEGEVGSDEMKKKAEDLALTVDGVTKVINKIVVNK